MENIEQTIVELGGIFSKLAHMVKEQEEEIKRYLICFDRIFFLKCPFFVNGSTSFVHINAMRNFASWSVQSNNNEISHVWNFVMENVHSYNRSYAMRFLQIFVINLTGLTIESAASSSRHCCFSGRCLTHYCWVYLH